MPSRVVGEEPLSTIDKTAKTTKAIADKRITRPRFFISTPIEVNATYEPCRRSPIILDKETTQ
jgi:hypothetical protein